MMKIIQITDLHVANEGVDTHGVDVRQNFLDVLRAVRAFSPDLLVLTGDLSYDVPNEQVYLWIKSQLEALEIPYAIIAGNHDGSAVMAHAFGLAHLLSGDELYYKMPIDGGAILFLETSSGTVSDTQLAWLEAELGQLDQDTLIFMHHPPINGGVPYMDKNYPLRNAAVVLPVLQKFPHHVSVFCGHYHVEKLLCAKNVTVHITPSTYFQMKWSAPEFAIDHLRIAYREINLRDDGVVESTVVYLDGNKNEEGRKG